MSRRRETMNTTLSGIGDIVDIKTTRNGRVAQGSEGALSKWAVDLIDKRQDVMRANGEKLSKDKKSLRAIECIATSPSLKRALELSDEIAQMRLAAKTDAEKAAVVAKEDELTGVLSAAYDQAAESGDKKQRVAYDRAEDYIINATVIGTEGAQALDDMRTQAAGAFRNLLEKKEDESDTAQDQQPVGVTPPEKPSFMRRIAVRIGRAAGDMAVSLREMAKSTKNTLAFAANMARGTIANFLAVRSEDYDNPAEYRRAKIEATKKVMGATGVLAVVAVAAVEAVKWHGMISPAARAAGIAVEGTSFGEVDNNLSLGTPYEHPEYAMGTTDVFDTDGAAVPEVYGETELLSYNVDTDPYNADKLDVFNMSDGFTSETIESSLAEWKSDVVRSPEMMAMLLDQYGDIDPTLLDDDLSNSAELFSGAQHQVVDIINGMKDVHYTTVPANTEYSSYYTFMDEDGNFQLGRSFGVSHDHDITFMVGTIIDADGNEKQIMINTECGQICNFEPTIGSDDIPVIPRTPPESPTPETPQQIHPGTPISPPDSQSEESLPTGKDSVKNIDENSQLDQSVANGGEKHDSGEHILPEQMVQPGKEHTPPGGTTDQPLTPGAEPITGIEQEIREELPNEGGESNGRI